MVKLLIYIIVSLSFCFIGFSCNHRAQKTTKVIFHIKYGYNKKIKVESIPFKNEEIILIDSGVAKKDYDSLIFFIRVPEERLFRIYAEEVNMNIQFINDTPEMDIYANYANVTAFKIEHSPASTSLLKFIERQDSIAATLREISREIDRSRVSKNINPSMDSLNKLLAYKLSFFLQQYKNFEDTVTSPAAFLAIYNNVDFGTNVDALKLFITKAGSRFPKHRIIQKLKNENLAYIKIFEVEYNIGDTLPSISLPDSHNQLFSTQSLRGKYYFIDFWSTWCNSCLRYLPEKKTANEIFPAGKFQLVSVALDDEKERWLKLIHDSKLNWRQLIDTNVWQGIAVGTLKFDSIPFNFLVSPKGIILHKAIRQDSIIFYISKYIPASNN